MVHKIGMLGAIKCHWRINRQSATHRRVIYYSVNSDVFYGMAQAKFEVKLEGNALLVMGNVTL